MSVAGLVLDAGPLIAAERNDRRFFAWWKLAMQRDVLPVVPAPVVAQVWRDGARQARLARVLQGCMVVALDQAEARRVGRLLALAGTDDMVDASVVSAAVRTGATVMTTDPQDLHVLAVHAPTVTIQAL